MSIPIALPTSRVPKSNALQDSITAIIFLTPERSCELLELMQDIRTKAQHSSRTFKISSFEPAALYVPSRTLIKQPAPGDFLVLDDDFVVTQISPVKVVHADVLPSVVAWEAYDEQERFKLTTVELSGEVLKAIARGFPLPPNSTNQAIRNASARPMIFNLIKDWPFVH